MIGVCKFCGCTEWEPCSQPIWLDSDFCGWLLEDVCTNPDCVLKAYLEARPAAEHLMFALGLIVEAA